MTVNLEYVYCETCDEGLVLYLGADEPCPFCGGDPLPDVGIAVDGTLLEGLMLLRSGQTGAN